MLWFLRKVFGTIALVWVLGWLLAMVGCLAAPKEAAPLIAVMYFSNIVGIPASIIWAVLKIISVLGARRAATPAPLAMTHPKRQKATGRVLDFELAPPPAASQANWPVPANPPSPEPHVYTYAAPGMPMCPKCGQRPAIFFCSTHQSAVCIQCVAQHDSPKDCVYIPTFRAPRTEPARPAKTGSIFGLS